jgi:hypothetical protein
MNHVLSIDTVESIGTVAPCNSRQLIIGRAGGTHYGFYNNIVGVGILVGNLATGSIMGAARQVGVSELIWPGLVLVGITAALALNCLEPGPSSGGSKHGIASVIRARELLKSLVEQRQEARSRVDITLLRIRRANPNGAHLTHNTIPRPWQ